MAILLHIVIFERHRLHAHQEWVSARKVPKCHAQLFYLARGQLQQLCQCGQEVWDRGCVHFARVKHIMRFVHHFQSGRIYPALDKVFAQKALKKWYVNPDAGHPGRESELTW